MISTNLPRIAGALIVGALVASLGLSACSKKEGGSKDAPATGAAPRDLPAVTDDVTQMLGGLKKGDQVEGFTVTLVSGVTAEGSVRLEFEREGSVASIEVALLSEEPIPPVKTTRYALFTRNAGPRKAAGSEETAIVLNAIGDRVRRREADVPAPKGLTKLRKPGVPG